MSTNPVAASIEKAIDDRKFTFFEMAGFSEHPRLALTVGAAIGYKLATEDFYKKLDGLIDKAVEDSKRMGDK